MGQGAKHIEEAAGPSAPVSSYDAFGRRRDEFAVREYEERRRKLAADLRHTGALGEGGTEAAGEDEQPRHLYPVSEALESVRAARANAEDASASDAHAIGAEEGGGGGGAEVAAASKLVAQHGDFAREMYGGQSALTASRHQPSRGGRGGCCRPGGEGRGAWRKRRGWRRVVGRRGE